MFPLFLRPSQTSPNPSPSFVVQDSVRVSEQSIIIVTRPQKKQKCFKSRVGDVILWLEEDIQWGDMMDYVEKVLVGRIKGRSYSAAQLKT